MGFIEIIRPKLIKKSGQHILIGGITGSGKTQILYFILDYIIKYHPQETIIWFDTGKSAEILRLATFKKVKIFYPLDNEYTRNIKIKLRKKEKKENLFKIKTQPFTNIHQIFKQLKKDSINVISVEPFYQDDFSGYTRFLNEFFKELFRRAMNYTLNPPLALFIDEVHTVAPAQGSAYNEEHMQAGVRFQRNIERLRSAGVRIVGTIQDWTKFRRGARTAFPWIVIKRGMTFTDRDLPQLAKYNDKWWRLGTDESIWVYPDRSFYTENVITDFYGDGKYIGRIYYEEIKKPPPLDLVQKAVLPLLDPSSKTEQVSPG